MALPQCLDLSVGMAMQAAQGDSQGLSWGAFPTPTQGPSAHLPSQKQPLPLLCPDFSPQFHAPPELLLENSAIAPAFCHLPGNKRVESRDTLSSSLVPQAGAQRCTES